MVYWELAKKGFAIHLQYRLSHIINNLGSAIFGFVYMGIWVGVLAGKEHVSPYRVEEMLHYMAFMQSLLWVATFTTPGLEIDRAVRTGAISLEMARPVSFYGMKLSQEAGRLAYNLLHRSLPLALVFALTTGIHVPGSATEAVWAAVSVLLAAWINSNMNYLIGITACWTVEIRWAHLTYHTLLFGLGGQLVPIDLFPEVLASVILYLPFASILYIPAQVWLGKGSPDMMWLQVAWCVVLALLNLRVTRRARMKLEIQGG
ncbi:ABC transporter permease [Staphylospora marina]|uniref:ABC transporter permease n=1 Tax=Staphylospora marina TaxID=2490858 RepID=UPI0013DDC151|nr:ABC-2 family transporter protein [Staphylospora marina]